MNHEEDQIQDQQPETQVDDSKPLINKENEQKIEEKEEEKQNQEEKKQDAKIDVEKLQRETMERVSKAQDGAEQEAKEIAGKLNLQGTPIQLTQQNALLILACQLIVCTFLSLLIAQIDPVAFVWNLIPILDVLTVSLFLLCIVAVQFLTGFVAQKPQNFLFFCVHSVSKVFLLVYITIWIDDLRAEVMQVSFIFLIGYMLFNIYIPTQTNEPCDLTIKGNWLKLTIYSLSVSIFLILFTRSEWYVLLFIVIISLIYAFYLLLCLQRFSEFEYLQENMNDYYLGAAQIDADMLIPCYLISFHWKNRGEQEQQGQEQQGQEQQGQEQQGQEQQEQQEQNGEK